MIRLLMLLWLCRVNVFIVKSYVFSIVSMVLGFVVIVFRNSGLVISRSVSISVVLW